MYPDSWVPLVPMTLMEHLQQHMSAARKSSQRRLLRGQARRGGSGKCKSALLKDLPLIEADNLFVRIVPAEPALGPLPEGRDAAKLAQTFRTAFEQQVWSEDSEAGSPGPCAPTGTVVPEGVFP